jgi:hypothetical protein
MLTLTLISTILLTGIMPRKSTGRAKTSHLRIEPGVLADLNYFKQKWHLTSREYTAGDVVRDLITMVKTKKIGDKSFLAKVPNQNENEISANEAQNRLLNIQHGQATDIGILEEQVMIVI